MHSPAGSAGQLEESLVYTQIGNIDNPWEVENMKYAVHLFPTVRVKVEVEAESQHGAIAKALEIDLHPIVDHGEVEYSEDAIEIILVDESGDEEYDNSKWYGLCKNGEYEVVE